MTRVRREASVQIHGPALRFVREAAGRSIGQLARAADVSVGFLARVERGVKRGVRVQVFDVLVRELGLADHRVLLVDPYQTVAGVEPTATNALHSTRTERAA